MRQALWASKVVAYAQSLDHDFLGAHTDNRVDKPGVFHTEWSGDRSETEQS